MLANQSGAGISSEIMKLYAGFADLFTNLLNYVTSAFFIILYFVFNLVFAALVSNWIMTSFEKKTLANNLRRGGELL